MTLPSEILVSMLLAIELTCAYLLDGAAFAM